MVSKQSIPKSETVDDVAFEYALDSLEHSWTIVLDGRSYATDPVVALLK